MKMSGLVLTFKFEKYENFCVGIEIVKVRFIFLKYDIWKFKVFPFKFFVLTKDSFCIFMYCESISFRKMCWPKILYKLSL